MAKHCQHAGPKRSAGRVKIGKHTFTAHKCSAKTTTQRQLARASKECAGTGKVGSSKRGQCISKHMQS